MSETWLRIVGEGLSAEINPMGAELSRLTDAEGLELLWDGDPAWWTGRAPLLFPVVGGLNGGRYRLGDQTYPMAKHGFARTKLFNVIEQSADRVVLRLEADEQTRAVYPFEFRLDVAFAMEGGRLINTATISNLGDGEMPACFGFHPAFRWPLPYGGDKLDHRLHFDEPQPQPIRRVGDDGLVRPEHLPTPVEGRDMALREDLFVNDAVIFDQLASRNLVYGAVGRPGLKVSFPDSPHLGVWTKPGADYICIEPWSGFADAQNYDGDILGKPGVFLVQQGIAKSFRLEIALIEEDI
ncbi:aldose 1-epimerase family protein [Caulobacter sp. NIBR2454]|uniref:aldose 1-epimerase family protein n=1 Tax=Caulobacter sp. NIBR2454 TaxID=3015996 RepID=UPI0022B61C17|nr:aldose 1-epimerase family protein [Caulobacter sp. NIBR2454]